MENGAEMKQKKPILAGMQVLSAGDNQLVSIWVP